MTCIGCSWRVTRSHAISDSLPTWNALANLGHCFCWLHHAHTVRSCGLFLITLHAAWSVCVLGMQLSCAKRMNRSRCHVLRGGGPNPSESGRGTLGFVAARCKVGLGLWKGGCALAMQLFDKLLWTRIAVECWFSVASIAVFRIYRLLRVSISSVTPWEACACKWLDQIRTTWQHVRTKWRF